MQSDWLQQFMRKDSEVSRRTFMQGGLVAGVAAVTGVAGAQVAQAQTTVSEQVVLEDLAEVEVLVSCTSSRRCA